MDKNEAANQVPTRTSARAAIIRAPDLLVQRPLRPCLLAPTNKYQAAPLAIAAKIKIASTAAENVYRPASYRKDSDSLFLQMSPEEWKQLTKQSTSFGDQLFDAFETGIGVKKSFGRTSYRLPDRTQYKSGHREWHIYGANYWDHVRSLLKLAETRQE